MKRRKPDFRNQSHNEYWYDLIEDYSLIESSFATQYGIRLRYTEMTWSEFCSLLSGIMPETPLGQIVAIRSENDRDRLKHFTPEQRRIRYEWIKKQAENISKEEYSQMMDMFKSVFKSLGGAENE